MLTHRNRGGEGKFPMGSKKKKNKPIKQHPGVGGRKINQTETTLKYEFQGAKGWVGGYRGKGIKKCP